MTQPAPPPAAGYTPDQFFTAGGTLNPEAPSYVKRPSDDELYEHILKSDFCYILTSRQMGKSSLMARTSFRLDAEGIHSAIIDLTRIDKTNAETWYKGLLDELNRRLRLGVKVAAWWQEHTYLGPVQRFSNFLEDVLLKNVSGQIVIFIDEIDTTLRLDFSDDFFAAIRSYYNARPFTPDFNRLTFVLLGVASPADLIKDRTRTPFNIGTGIILRRFSRKDISILEPGLEAVYPGKSKEILDHVYRWTNGHPYLTQKLCKELVERRLPEYSAKQLDNLVRLLFLTEQASKEENLQFVRNTLLGYKNRRELLDLYAKVLRGKVVPDDKQSMVQEHLKLSGVVVAENGVLTLHNKLYQQAFNLVWVRQHNAINWTPYLVTFGVLAGLVALCFAGILYYNSVWLANHMTASANCFYKPNPGQNRQDCLAEFFQRKPILAKNPYPTQGRSLFFSYLTYSEQLDLFAQPPPRVNPNSLLLIVTGLYSSLAETANTPNSELLLQTMQVALQQRGPADETAGSLAQEITGWLSARNAADLGDYSLARQEFLDGPLAVNPNNQAVLYEYACILIRLGEADPAQRDSAFHEALTALDRVVQLAGQEYQEAPLSPTATPTTGEQTIITPTLTIAESPTSGFASSLTSPAPTATSLPTATRDAGLMLTQTVAQLLGTKQFASPTLYVPPITATPSPTLTATPSPTITPTPSLTPTPTPIPTPIQRINPGFASLGEVLTAVRVLIESNTELAQLLRDSAAEDYASLKQRFQVEQIVQAADATQQTVGMLPRTATLQALETALVNAQQTRLAAEVTGESPTPTPTPLPPQTSYLLQLGYPMYTSTLADQKECPYLGVAGQIFDLNEAPKTGIVVEVSGFLGLEYVNGVTISGSALDYGESGWEFTLGDYPVVSHGTLYVQLLDQAGNPLSEKVYFDTSDNCDQNLVLMNFAETAIDSSRFGYVLEVDNPDYFYSYDSAALDELASMGILGKFNRWDALTKNSYLIWYLPRRLNPLDVSWRVPDDIPEGVYNIETFVPGIHAGSFSVEYSLTLYPFTESQVEVLNQARIADLWVVLFDQVTLEPGAIIRQSLQTNEVDSEDISIGPIRLVPAAAQPRFDAPVGTLDERNSDQIWPGDWFDALVYGSRMGSTGVYQTGADLNLNLPNDDSDRDAPVYAIGDGIVIHVLQDSQTYGNLVVIYHPEARVAQDSYGSLYTTQPVYSRYHALADGVLVKEGDRVVRGQQIGNIGLNPLTKRYFLCFEVSESDILATQPAFSAGDNWSYVWLNFTDPRQFLRDNH